MIIKPNKENFQERFIASIGLFVSVSSLVSTFINCFLGFNLELIITTSVSSVVYGYMFYLSFYKHDFKMTRIIFTIYSPIFINILWYYNYGSIGPVPYNFVVYLSVIVFIWDRKKLIVIGIFIFLNIMCLMIFELINPEVFKSSYPSVHSRIIDVYVAVTIYSGVIYILISSAKKNLELQINKAKYADQLKSSFLANVSHEIRTPLNAILGFSELLCYKDVSKEKKMLYTELIHSNGIGLTRLIDDIIDISKIESNQIVIHETTCSVPKLFHKIYQTFFLSLKKYHKTHLSFSYDSPSPPFVITTDEFRLEQILTNLITNAIKFTTKGSIQFGCNVKENHVEFYVKDTGKGIPPEDADKIFHRFIKLNDEANTYEHGGMGIGLFLSKEIISLLGGEIRMKSIVNKGTTFIFTLPKKDYREVKPSKEVFPEQDSLDLIDKSILIVEDNESNYMLLAEMLIPTRTKLYRAVDGKEALKVFFDNQDKIDLILMDINLPLMDGFETTKKIRGVNPVIPIIALTACAMTGDREKCIKAGCNDYLTKPVLKEILFPVISKCLKNG